MSPSKKNSDRDLEISNENRIEEISPSPEGAAWWLRAAVLLIFLAILIIGFLLIRAVFWGPPAPRTAVESDIMRAETQIRANPRDYQARMYLGYIYLTDLEDTGKATDQFIAAITLEPKNPNAHYGLGLTYIKEGKTEEAIKKLTETLKLDPKFTAASIQLGQVYIKEKKYPQAVEVLNKGIEVDPTIIELHYYLGLAYERKGEKDLALKEYGESLRYAPNYSPAYYRIGRVYLEREQYPEAAEGFKKAIEFSPGSAEVHYYLGLSYEKTDQKDLAVKEYRQALKYSPKYSLAKKALERLSKQ